jgi:hypothetical protein
MSILLKFAETVPEIDVETLFAKKKVLVKEALQLTEKEGAVFWPLYNVWCLIRSPIPLLMSLFHNFYDVVSEFFFLPVFHLFYRCQF